MIGGNDESAEILMLVVEVDNLGSGLTKMKEVKDGSRVSRIGWKIKTQDR